MAALEDVINQAISDAGGSENDDSTGDTGTETTEIGGGGGETVGEETTKEVVEGVEGEGDEGAKAPESTPVGETKAKEITEEGKEKAKTDDDPIAKELGDERDKNGKVNRIPHPRVKQIVEKAVARERETLTTAHTTAIAERDTKLKDQGEYIDRVTRIESIMVEDPDRFLTMLPYVNPKYAELLAKVAPEETKSTVVSTDDIKLPPPDYDLGNGQKTYSVEGLQSFVTALVTKVSQQTRAETLAEVDKRVKPVVERHETAEKMNSVLDQIQQRVDYARQNWPGFKDNEPAIQRLVIDKKMSMQDAYLKVKEDLYQEGLAKAKTDEAALREKIMKELKERPTSTSTTTGAAVSRKSDPAAPGTRPLEAVINDAIAKSGLK